MAWFGPSGSCGCCGGGTFNCNDAPCFEIVFNSNNTWSNTAGGELNGSGLTPGPAGQQQNFGDIFAETFDPIFSVDNYTPNPANITTLTAVDPVCEYTGEVQVANNALDGGILNGEIIVDGTYTPSTSTESIILNWGFYQPNWDTDGWSVGTLTGLTLGTTYSGTLTNRVYLYLTGTSHRDTDDGNAWGYRDWTVTYDFTLTEITCP